MKNKKVAIFTLIIGILLIITGLTMSVCTYIDKQNKQKKQVENTILEKYDVFKDNVESFNDIRKVYYTDVASNLYPESVEEEYEDWLIMLENYTKQVDSVENSSNELKEYCVNKYYSNEDVKNKCDSFVIAYETTINYYAKDIISFNEVIDTYQRNIVEENESIHNYELKYDYIDINLDGKFIGRD